MSASPIKRAIRRKPAQASAKRVPAKKLKRPAESENALRRREAVRQGVVRIGRLFIQLALRRIEHPSKTDRTEDIHQVRVQCKRLRALLRLLRPVTNADAIKRENLRLRDAARALSGFRDAFVVGETLKRVFEDTAPRQMRDAARMLGVKPRAPKQKKGLDTVMAEMADTLRRTATQLRKLPFSTRGWFALAPGLERSYRRARAAHHECADHSAGHLGNCFHTWRKRVKDLSYQLEIFDNLEPGDIRRLRKGFRRLGTLLGDDHDYLNFASQVREREQHYADLANFRPVRKRLRRRLKKLRAVEFAIADPLFADKPKVWIARLAGWWRIWKNPNATPVLTVEHPVPTPAKPVA